MTAPESASYAAQDRPAARSPDLRRVGPFNGGSHSLRRLLRTIEVSRCNGDRHTGVHMWNRALNDDPDLDPEEHAGTVGRPVGINQTLVRPRIHPQHVLSPRRKGIRDLDNVWRSTLNAWRGVHPQNVTPGARGAV